jgi:2-isopropylmalate synthase
MTTKLELFDTTLRDGAQGAGAKTKSAGRRHWFGAMNNFGVPFVEMGLQSVNADRHVPDDIDYCVAQGGNSKVVAFGSTSKKQRPSEDNGMGLLADCKAPVACIFGKSDEEHVKGQLSISLEDNEKRIEESARFLTHRGKEVFYDAEHFFDGFRKNPGYALKTLEAAAKGGATRLVLCDTNGGTPATARWGKEGVAEIVKKTREYLDERGIRVPLGLHMHNDRGEALGSTLAALDYLRGKQEVVQVQGTMNGTGERSGNLNLATLIGNYATGEMEGLAMKVELQQLKAVADASFLIQGLPLPDPDTRPFVGEVAFAHKGGVHVDAMKKMGNGAYEFADPERFGNQRIYVLNSLGGGATVELVAKSFGIDLDKRDKKTATKIEESRKMLVTFENKGYRLGALRAEQYLLIQEAFGNKRRFFEVTGCRSEMVDVGRKRYNEADLSLDIEGRDVRKIIAAKGPVDALYKAFQAGLGRAYPVVKDFEIVGFDSKIAQRHGEASSMRTMAVLSNKGHLSETVGVNGDIILAARKALEHGIRYQLMRHYAQQGKN